MKIEVKVINLNLIVGLVKMSDFLDKIYDIHGKVESLETDFKNMNDKLDNALNPKRTCLKIQKIEHIVFVLIVVFLLSILVNPNTKALAEIILKAVL